MLSHRWQTAKYNFSTLSSFQLALLLWERAALDFNPSYESFSSLHSTLAARWTSRMSLPRLQAASIKAQLFTTVDKSWRSSHQPIISRSSADHQPIISRSSATLLDQVVKAFKPKGLDHLESQRLIFVEPMIYVLADHMYRHV